MSRKQLSDTISWFQTKFQDYKSTRLRVIIFVFATEFGVLDETVISVFQFVDRQKKMPSVYLRLDNEVIYDGVNNISCDQLDD